MAELRAALVVLKLKADSGVLQTQIGGPAVPAGKKKSRTLPILIAAASVVVLAAGGGGWWWMTHRHAQQNSPVAQAIPTPPVTAPPVPDTAAAPAETAAPVDAGMTNQNVLDMVDAKVPSVTIVSQIRSASKTNFDLSTAGIIALTKGGVAAPIIEVMRNPKVAAPPSGSVLPPTTKSTPAVVPPPTKTASATVETAPAAATAAPPSASVQPAPTTASTAAPIRIHTVSVPDGKPFNITLAQDVPTKLTAGQKINFTITNDVKVGDAVVIAKGTPVLGEVVDPGDPKKVLIVINKGKATFKLSSVDSTGGSKLNIRATPGHTEKGDRPIELQGTKSKELVAPAGTEYMSYIDTEQTVTIKH
jgi:hypothetical protein